MKINTNIGLKNRSKVTLSNFRGLDTLSSVVDVSAIHSTDMENLISRDGVNHKRYGWKTIARLRKFSKFLNIQGIFSFTIYSTKFLMVYAEKRFWLVNNDMTFTDITNKSMDMDKNILDELVLEKYRVVEDNLDDAECKFFVNGNKVYFVGCGDLLVFSKWNNDYFELRRVVGNEDAYIPTTTENIGWEGVISYTKEDGSVVEQNGAVYKRITAEEKNMLSPYSYNTLFGVEHLGEGQSVNYLLDTKDFDDLEIEIHSTNKDGEFTKTLKSSSEKKDEYKTGDRVLYANVGKSIDYVRQSRDNDSEKRFNDFDQVLVLFNNEEELRIKIDSYKFKVILDLADSIIYVPEKISYSLVYRKSDGTDDVLASVSEKNIDCKVEKIGELIEVTANIDFGTFAINLSKYNAILGAITPTTTLEPNNKELIFEQEEYKAVASKVDGTLKFIGKGNSKAYAPVVADTPNIKVKIKKPIDESSIVKAQKGCEFGTMGTPDRLFVVDATGNTVRWSKDNDFTYFGHKSWCVCGTADKRITGIDRLNDSTLLLVKEYSPLEPSIFVISGALETSTTEGSTIDYQAIFRPKGFQVGMGAVGNVINFNGDCLMVAKDGLYAVSLGENMTVDARYLLHRSRQISNTISKFDLSQSKCIAFNGKFYIAVGGEKNECYVADNKYTSSFKGDMQNVVNYEWWKWTNIPVNVWGYIDDELCFGTSDGRICKFTEEFNDETITELEKEMVSYVVENDIITGFGINEAIKVNKGDILTPKCDFYGKIETDKCEKVGNEIRFYLPLDNYNDKEIIRINGKDYEITKQSMYFSVTDENDEIDVGNKLVFYKNYKNYDLIIDDAEKITLKDKSGNFPIWEKEGNTPSADFFARLYQKSPVVAKWVSGAMDLGTRSYSKTLTYIVLTGEKDLANRLKYSLITRTSQRDYEHLRSNNGFDFGQLDLETLSLDSDFASSYAKRLNIRDANFIMLYLESDTNEDLAINSVQIEFKICKRNIGVK